MTEQSDCCKLGAPGQDGWTPIVEADDVYLGGERNEGSGTAHTLIRSTSSRLISSHRRS